MSRLTPEQRYDRSEFCLIRMGEEYDAQPRDTLPRATFYAVRHLWRVVLYPARYAARWSTHPDYREEWR